eukprot:TRINITY_DN300_c0_g1_i1.p1 TRINITY_DN300_c0_g1~~TRINITY_DN300_c0_g1_i1.p1  ORF type:complete len:515 (-),score=77.77 TRINITY_DN300_c0_g1_i1:905-2449(-)
MIYSFSPFWDVLSTLQINPLQTKVVQSQEEITQVKSLYETLSTKKTVFQTGNTKKNVIMIVTESLEQAYYENPVLKRYIPDLVKYQENSYSFDNIKSYPGTTFTAAGLFSLFCSLPLLEKGAGNTAFASFDPSSVIGTNKCFPGHLKKNGYKTVFMNGGRANFGGKGNIVKAAGISEFYGFKDWEKEHPKSHFNSWGLYDSFLFQHSYDKVKELEKQFKENGDPYFLSLLTVSTHGPHGFMDFECAHMDIKEEVEFLRTLKCHNHMLIDLLRKLEETVNLDNTMIVLVADHIAMRNQISDILDSIPNRRISFMMKSNWLDFKRNHNVGTHFDVGPTIMEALGHSLVDFHLGQSLMSNSQGYCHEHDISSAFLKKNFDIYGYSHHLKECSYSKQDKEPSNRKMKVMVNYRDRLVNLNGENIHVTQSGNPLSFRNQFVIKVDHTFKIESIYVKSTDSRVFESEKDFEDSIFLVFTLSRGFQVHTGPANIYRFRKRSIQTILIQKNELNNKFIVSPI